MDFLKLIRSFEDFLFEILSWIIYYPVTLWRVIRRPLQMIHYSDHEQRETGEEQYTDTLSPPLFLLATLALLHMIEMATGMPEIQAETNVGRSIVSSDQNLVLLRSFLFGLLPLFVAWRYVSARGLPLERKNLKPPFFGQCYPAAIYAMGVSLALHAGDLNIAVSGDLMLLGLCAATIWYLAVQTWQFRASLGCTTSRALFLSLRAYVEAAVAFVAIALAIMGLPD